MLAVFAELRCVRSEWPDAAEGTLVEFAVRAVVCDCRELRDRACSVELDGVLINDATSAESCDRANRRNRRLEVASDSSLPVDLRSDPAARARAVSIRLGVARCLSECTGLDDPPLASDRCVRAVW
jgi:hypothetical protein